MARYSGQYCTQVGGNGILLPKLFWPTVRKNCSSDREKLLKFEAEDQEFAKFPKFYKNCTISLQFKKLFCLSR